MPRPLTRALTRSLTTQAGTDLVATVGPLGITFRYPRRRQRYLLPWGKAFTEAVRLEVERQRREKLAQKKARTVARGGR